MLPDFATLARRLESIHFGAVHARKRLALLRRGINAECPPSPDVLARDMDAIGEVLDLILGVEAVAAGAEAAEFPWLGRVVAEAATG
jgi:hypothetical protein